LHGDRAGADVDPQPLAGAAAEQGRLHRPGTAPVHPLALLVPVVNTLRARVAADHALAVVVGVVGQGLNGDQVSVIDLDERPERLAEVTPVDGLVRGGYVVIP